MNTRTRQAVALAKKREEYCPLCGWMVEPMVVHLAAMHKQAKMIGEIIWLNNHEAVYKGKHYKEKL